jgi:hypothetical protein
MPAKDLPNNQAVKLFAAEPVAVASRLARALTHNLLHEHGDLIPSSSGDNWVRHMWIILDSIMAPLRKTVQPVRAIGRITEVGE